MAEDGRASMFEHLAASAGSELAAGLDFRGRFGRAAESGSESTPARPAR